MFISKKYLKGLCFALALPILGACGVSYAASDEEVVKPCPQEEWFAEGISFRCSGQSFADALTRYTEYARSKAKEAKDRETITLSYYVYRPSLDVGTNVMPSTPPADLVDELENNRRYAFFDSSHNILAHEIGKFNENIRPTESSQGRMMVWLTFQTGHGAESGYQVVAQREPEIRWYVENQKAS